jgi:hypothetical protein
MSELEEAEEHLFRAIAIEPGYRKYALLEPELRPFLNE